VYFFKDILSSSLNSPGLAGWLYFLPFTLLLVSIIKVCNAWLIRVKNFKATSINKVSQKLAEVSSQLLFGFFKAPNGLIFGDFAGKIFNTGFSIYQIVKSGFNKKFVSKQTIKNNLLIYLDFPKYGILPSMLNTLGGMLPVFIISRYYSVEISGSFNFSRIILSVPFALIASGVSQVLMQQVSEKRHKRESISSDLFQLTWKLCALSGFGTLIIFLAGPEIFEFIFGTKWKLSGEYTSILIFSYAISFVVSPFSVLLNVLGKIKWASFWQVFYFVFISILWFLSDFRINNFLLAIVIIDVIAYLIYGFLIYKSVRYYENNLSLSLS
jgi:O-antigen/teichoic acid export membrane protein